MQDSYARAQIETSLNVSRETIAALDDYTALLKKWNPAINLVAKSTISQIWTRHFLDSAQIWQIVKPTSGRWVDFGAGGGFPGLVIAILAKELAPSLLVTLVESDIRKATFLRQVSLSLALATEVLSSRAEVLKNLEADYISARAMAALPKLLELVEQHGNSGVISLFPKGKSFESELTQAEKSWTFDVQKTQSLTDPDGVILKIEGVRRV